MVGLVAEYERELIRERSVLRLDHARKSGVKVGRPAKLNADQAAELLAAEAQATARKKELMSDCYVVQQNGYQFRFPSSPWTSCRVRYRCGAIWLPSASVNRVSK